MLQSDLMDAMVQVKRMGNLYHELLDLSNQLAQAVDREDEISVAMLLSMRQEPIEKLKAADAVLRNQKEHLSAEDWQRLAELLNGGAPTRPEEEKLAEFTAANRRIQARILEVDRAVSLKLARGQSIYQTGT